MEFNFISVFVLISMLGLGWLVFSIPTDYMNGYVEWVHMKHGKMTIGSIGFLLLATGIGILMMLTKPGKYPLVEMVSCGVVIVVLTVGIWDNYKFYQSKFKSDKTR